jgi:F0F1-type ATP synthase assembly protein I
LADDDNSGWGKGFTYGLEVAVGIGLGCLIGTWWDKHYHTGPWGLLIGIMLGCAAGMYLLIKDMNRDGKR